MRNAASSEQFSHYSSFVIMKEHKQQFNVICSHVGIAYNGLLRQEEAYQMKYLFNMF